jgi:hypothetical protein
MKPRCALVFAHSIARSTDPPHFAADAHALNEAQRRQQHRAPDADAVVTRHQRHGESGQAHEQQRRDQRRLAADAIAVVTEDECSDGPRQETDRVDPERLQGADQRLGIGEVQLGEHQPRHGGVKKEVVPLDGGPYRAGDDGARELSAVLRTPGPHRRVRHRAVLYSIGPPSAPLDPATAIMGQAVEADGPSL